MPSEYKIDLSASGDVSYYHVRKALGPWPLKNWSMRPVFTSTSRLDAEDWIRRTLFTESPEGQRQALEAERQRRALQEAQKAEREKLESEGWVWDASCCFFRNRSTGEVKEAWHGQA